MRKVIITADDYGMSKSVNEAIEEGIKNSVITSTNVMVNMPFCDDAAGFKARFPDVSIGIHWNLTVGRPVTDHSAVKTLTDDNGAFLHPGELMKRFRSKSVDMNEIRLELVNQLKAYRRICGEPEYWSTHENIHVHLGIFGLFIKTASGHGIRKMRWHNKVWAEDMHRSLSIKGNLLELLKSLVFFLWRMKAKREGMSFPDGLIVVSDSINSLADENVSIKWGNSKIGELTIHPAKSIDSEYFGEMTGNRIDDYRSVSDTALIENILSKYKLASYNEL